MTETLRISPPMSSDDLNALFAAAWPDHTPTDYAPILSRSLLYVCVYDDGQLVGFVNVVWDGGKHAFILDTTVHPAYRRRGMGVRLVQAAADAARERGIKWLHVDYEPHLSEFYRQCGFHRTEAGLMNLER